MASFRVCCTTKCKNRLPDLKFDRHTRCSSCIGHFCFVDKKCDECSSWPNEFFFAKFIKHRKRLEYDRICKAKVKELKKTKAIEAVSAPATSAIECKEKVLDQGNAGNLQCSQITEMKKR